MRQSTYAIILILTSATSPIQAQTVDDIFDDSGLLKATALPIIINMANGYFIEHQLPFSYVKLNNLVTRQIFETQFTSPVDADLTADQRSKLHAAVYSQYSQIVFQNWNSILNTQMVQAASAMGLSNPATCTNYTVGTIWEVFANSFNSAKLQGKTDDEANTAGWNAVKAAFPCYGRSGGGGALPAGYIQTWEEVWAWFVRASLVN